MAKLSIFEELVASEAAVRADDIYRNQTIFYTDEKGVRKEYPLVQPDRGDTQAQVAKNLYESFCKIYDHLFQDSSQHHKIVRKKVCNIRHLEENQRKHMKGIFQQFADQNYDEHGILRISADEAPLALEKLYKRIKEVPLHNDGTAAGVLFVEMGRKGGKWEKVAPGGIDFTRGEPPSELTPHRSLRPRFDEAFNAPNHVPPSGKLFIEHPEHFLEIEGMRFLYKELEGSKKHLVTETGHLVDSTDALRKSIAHHISKRKPWDDFKVEVHDEEHSGTINHHLMYFQGDLTKTTPTEIQKIKTKITENLVNMFHADAIDGIGVKADGNRLPVSIVCMDVDLMTGLRMKKLPGESASELQQLKNFMTETASRTGIADFADLIPTDFSENILALTNEASKTAAREHLQAQIKAKLGLLWQVAQKYNGMAEIVERAGKKLETMLPRIYEASDKAFINESGKPKPPAKAQPHVYITQGGTGSGKSSFKAVAEKECGQETLVTASLDKAREECDRFWLYPATHNHNDDYKATEEFAKTIRDITTRRAQTGKYNILIDGSGIPYEGRNDKVSAAFKKNGYNVFVAAAQIPLYVDDPSRRKELSQDGTAFNDALFRVGQRMSKELWAVPVKITINKHIGFPIATHNAARDLNVDRFAIWDASPKPGEEYTLSYTKELSKSDLDKIKGLDGNRLRKKLIELKLVGPWVTLPPERNDGDKEHIFDYKVIRDYGKGLKPYRVEIITDMHQYINMVQKGLLARDAKCPEALHMNQVHCDVEGHFQDKGGRLKMRAADGVVVKSWVNYSDAHPVSGYHR